MSEALLLSRARCEEIFGLVAAAARSEGVADVEAMLAVGVNALTRFANNTIHQNVSERGGQISVRAIIEGRTARANSNRPLPLVNGGGTIVADATRPLTCLFAAAFGYAMALEASAL